MENSNSENQRTVSTRSMEVVVAALFMIVAAIVMYDSVRVGASWASDGPQAGYFPFYVGLIMFISGAITLATHIFTKKPDLTTFVERAQLKLVLSVLVPTAVFVVLIGWLGIYVSAALFIGFFMWRLGGYSPVKILAVAVPIPVALFLMFEVWFLVPLPKGPLEAALGY
jgi:hypothetical protein